MEHRGMKVWSKGYQDISYNSWLRGEALDSKNMLKKNMDRLQAQLLALDSVICLEQTSTQRLERVSVAIIHVLTEIHLLVTLNLQENK